MSVREAYAQAFSVIRLPAVMKLSAARVFSGFVCSV